MSNFEESYQVNGFYGSGETESLIYVVKTNGDTWWYCVDGGEMVNESTIELEEGCNVETDVNDIDCFQRAPVNSLTQFENIMNEHLAVETVDRVNFSLDIDGSINSAFQDDNAQAELIRILKAAIKKVESNTFLHEKIKDINGNNVGSIYLDIEEEEV